MGEVTLYVASALVRWTDWEVSIGIPLAERTEDGAIGMLPVYETIEEAEKANPGIPILTIVTMPPKEGAAP